MRGEMAARRSEMDKFRSLWGGEWGTRGTGENAERNLLLFYWYED